MLLHLYGNTLSFNNQLFTLKAGNEVRRRAMTGNGL